MTVTLAFKAFAKAIPCLRPFLATSDPSVLKRILAYIRGLPCIHRAIGLRLGEPWIEPRKGRVGALDYDVMRAERHAESAHSGRNVTVVLACEIIGSIRATITSRPSQAPVRVPASPDRDRRQGRNPPPGKSGRPRPC